MCTSRANLRGCVGRLHRGHLLTRMSLYGFSRKEYRGGSFPMVLRLAIGLLHKLAARGVAGHHTVGLGPLDRPVLPLLLRPISPRPPSRTIQAQSLLRET